MTKYFDTANRWAVALRMSMGYPLSAPLTDAIAFTTSGCREHGQEQHLAQLAVEAGQDIVHLLVEDDDALPSVSLIVRDGATVRVMKNATVYASDEVVPIQILTDDHSWIIGPRHILTEQKLPSIAQRKRGRVIAERRWRDLFELVGPIPLGGSKFVKLGGRLSDAVPTEQLSIVG